MPIANIPAVARHFPEGIRRPSTQISAPVSAGLAAMLDTRLMRPTVEKTTADALITQGYAAEGFGGLMLTDTGNFRARMETAQ